MRKAVLQRFGKFVEVSSCLNEIIKDDREESGEYDYRHRRDEEKDICLKYRVHIYPYEAEDLPLLLHPTLLSGIISDISKTAYDYTVREYR